MHDESSKNQQESEGRARRYKSYRQNNSQFVSAMAHAFLSDTEHTNVWRARLDAIANYAVVVTSVSLIIAFSQPRVHHGVIILNAFFVTLFLFVEATRYRFYEWWNFRLRLIETDFFATMLVPPFHPSSKWAESLVDNVLHFNPPVSLWEAIGLRLRRHYLWLFLITTIAWFIKYSLLPTHAANFTEFMRRATIDKVPGPIVIGFSFACFGALLLLILFTLSLTKVTGNALLYVNEDDMPEVRMHGKRSSQSNNETRRWLAPGQLFLTWIVTRKTDAVGKGIFQELGHDVTVVPGEGSTLLICTLTAQEIQTVRRIVAKEDPQASIHMLGKGVDPLSEE
jgi:uncharacterized membrane protein